MKVKTIVALLGLSASLGAAADPLQPTGFVARGRKSR